MIIVILAGLTLISQGKQCSQLPSDYTKIVAKENEKIVQNLQDYFGTIEYKDVVTLKDDKNKLSLLNPIELIYTMEMPQNINKFISYSVMTSSQFEWLNKYQLLAIRNNEELILTWTKHFVAGTQGNKPNFDSLIIIGNINEVKCHSSLILDPKHFLLDCYVFEDGNLNNKFYLINEDQEEIIMLENTYPLQADQKRYILSTNKYIYRITTLSNNNPSYVEIFTFDVLTNQIQRIAIIDHELIIQFINFREYLFEIVDVKVDPSDLIIIVDSTGNLFSLKLNINDWEFNWLDMYLRDPISFEYSPISKKIFVLLQYGVYYDLALQYFSFEDLSDSKIHLSKNLLYIVSSTKIIALSVQNLKPKYQIMGDFSNLLTDYTQNHFFSLSINNIKYYLTGQDYQIQFQNNQLDLKGQGILILNQCQVIIEYQTIDRKSKELIVVSKNSIIDLPFFSDTIYQQKPLINNINKLVSGPMQNISFQRVDQNNETRGGYLDYIGIQGDSIQIYDNELLNLKNLVFTQIISKINTIFSDDSYVIITQNQEKLLTIYKCQFYISQECSQFYQTTLTFKITSQNTVIHYSDQVLLFISLLDSKTLFYYYYESQQWSNKTITFTDQDPINEIENIFLQNNYKLILHSKTKKLIGVYDIITVNFLQVINSEQMNELGILDWNPQKLFCNNYNDILFILNGQKSDQVLILQLNSNFFSLQYIKYINQSKDIKIIAFIERFVILQQFDNNAITFEVFKFKELTNIYLEKTPSFYDYSVNDLNYVYWVTSQNLLYFKAKYENQEYLLSYLIEQTEHNSLHCVQKINETNQLIAAYKDKIFQFNEDVTQIYQIQRKPILTYQAKFEDNSFISNIKYSIVYKNGEELKVNRTFRLVNTYIDTKLYPKKLNINTNLSSQIQHNYRQDMGKDWYFGEISSFELNIPNVKNQTIAIIDPIEQVLEFYENYTVNIKDLNTNYVFILKRDGFSIVSKQTNQIVNEKLFTKGFECKNIIADYQSSILIMCIFEKIEYLGGVKCEESACQIGSWLNINRKVIFGQMDIDNIYLVTELGIYVYSNTILDLKNAKDYGLIKPDKDIEFFNQGLTIQKVAENLYHIYCIDKNFNYIVLEYTIKDDKIQRTNKLIQNLVDFINEEFYLIPSVEFVLIKVINIQNDGSTYKVDFIIFANIGPHYGIRAEFNCKTDSCVLNQQKIIFIFQGYGASQVDTYLLPKVIIKSKFVSIVYDYKKIANRFTQAVYEIPKIESTPSVVIFFGAIQDASHAHNSYFQSDMYLFKNQLYLISNLKQYGQLRLYKVNQSPQLLIDGNINETQVQLSLSNDYIKKSLQFNINVTDDTDDSNDQKGLKWLWLVLILIAGLIIVGVAVAICKKKKNTQNENLI